MSMPTNGKKISMVNLNAELECKCITVLLERRKVRRVREWVTLLIPTDQLKVSLIKFVQPFFNTTTSIFLS